MIKYQIISLLVTVVFFTASNGQVKTSLPKERGNELKPLPGTQTKLVKSQGAGTPGNVHCGLQDKAGNLWFGTTGEGVYRYDGTSFTNLTTKDSLRSNTVWSLLEDKTGNIWFASLGAREDGGVWRFNGKIFTNFATKDGLINNSVFSILEDRAGTIWFGTSNNGLCKYDGKTFTPFSA